MLTCDPIASTTSRGWATTSPAVTVVIATHDRSSYLPELVDALAGQADAPLFEVVIADDGSSDDTWPVLEQIVATTTVAIQALRLPACGGPSVPRNTAVRASRGAVVAFTDDDCLPSATWLSALVPGAQTGQIVQGATLPSDESRTSPWDRTISVAAQSGMWESCNLALPRDLFEAAGGFPVLDLLASKGRGFGEDAALGVAAARIAGGRWAPSAVVRHRWLPGDFRTYLDGMRRLEAMPALIRRLPELRQHCYARLFRNRRSAACDAAVVAIVTAAVVRRASPLLAAVPWLVLTTSAARWRWGRPLPVRAAQEATADLVGLAALVSGSVRARTPLL
jgi:glycosyltransferase involved in cell wall biosynthesis